MKQFFLKFWPILFIFILWFIFSSPYFLKGKVPYASTYQVNFFSPWSHYEKFWGPIKNNAMPDIHTQIYPWKKFTIESFKKGELPLWNPYNFSGNPHLANFQSAVLSPFNLLFFLLPFVDAWSILILLQPLLAGLFMFMFLRSLKISEVGSIVGSVTFMFCGFIVVWMAYGILAYAILYLPLALFVIEKYMATQKFWFLPLLTFTVPLSFFSGHFQTSFYFLIAILTYIIFKGVINKNPLSIFYLLSSIFFGLLLSLPQILPSVRLYLSSIRSELFLSGEAVSLNYLITIIVPDFFGNPVTRNDWFGHYAEWASFIGVWPLLLAIYAILRLRSWRVLFFSILGLGSVALAVNSPLSHLVVSLKIPVLSTSALSRIIVLFSFSFAAMSGFGFDRLKLDLEDKKAKKIITGTLFLMLVFLVSIWSLLLAGKIYPDEWLIVAKRNLILPTLLLGVGAVLILSNAYLKHKKLILLTSLFLLLASSFDSFRFAQKWMPFDPRDLVYPETPVIEGLRKNLGGGRVFGNISEAAISSYYSFASIEGYDPLYIGRYGEFIRSADQGEFLKGERSVVRLDRQGKYTDRVLDLLGVTLVFHPIADTGAGWAYPVWEKKERYELIYRDEKHELYKNKMAVSRVTLFYDLTVITDDKEIIKKFYSPDFNFRKTLIFEEKPLLEIKKEGTGSAKITQYSPNRVKIKVETTEPALLFLSDNYYPGWKAYVNGEETRIYRADYTFRAVAVPRGEKEVEFAYEDWYL